MKTFKATMIKVPAHVHIASRKLAGFSSTFPCSELALNRLGSSSFTAAIMCPVLYLCWFF